ncbi:MAG: hypothetical protein K2H35_07050 [Muribaculaceae bacterium]|nr:hypothetical protein [Muribaculaceae bacterium]
MRVIRNKYIPFKGFIAINLFGVLYVRGNAHLSDEILRHEYIHTLQMKELGYLFFYIIYIMEWIVRLFMHGNAYRNISFEREAYKFQSIPDYVTHRPKFGQWKKKGGFRFIYDEADKCI